MTRRSWCLIVVCFACVSDALLVNAGAMRRSVRSSSCCSRMMAGFGAQPGGKKKAKAKKTAGKKAGKVESLSPKQQWDRYKALVKEGAERAAVYALLDEQWHEVSLIPSPHHTSRSSRYSPHFNSSVAPRTGWGGGRCCTWHSSAGSTAEQALDTRARPTREPHAAHACKGAGRRCCWSRWWACATDQARDPSRPSQRLRRAAGCVGEVRRSAGRLSQLGSNGHRRLSGPLANSVPGAFEREGRSSQKFTLDIFRHGRGPTSAAL